MPRLNELQSTYRPNASIAPATIDLHVEETLVPDHRSTRSTTQILEEKLRRLKRHRERAHKDRA